MAAKKFLFAQTKKLIWFAQAGEARSFPAALARGGKAVNFFLNL